MLNKEDIVYSCKLTSDFSTSDKEDFINIFNRVFNLNYNMDWFNWKYIDNIYGDSYIVMAYHDEKLVGIRVFWRNDIDGHLCYQPCDTAVLDDYRRLGIFTKMTVQALNSTKGAFIYNFPNENSRPGNLKLGWNINKNFYLKPVVNKKKLEHECKYIEDKFFVWRFIKSPVRKYSYYEFNGKSYLLYVIGNNIYYILGRFNRKYNKQFKQVKSGLLFVYTEKKGFINNFLLNKATVVSLDNESNIIDNIDIPMFKADYF